MGFKAKLILSYIAIILISFIFTAFFLNKNLENNSLEEIQSSLINQARLIENQIPLKSLKNEDVSYLSTLVESLKPKVQCRVTLINTQGKVLADSDKSEQEMLEMEDHLDRPEVKTALSGSIGIDTYYSVTLKKRMLYIALPIKDLVTGELVSVKGSKIIGILRLALPLESVKKTLVDIRKIILLSLVFALVLAVLLGYIVAGNIIRPIKRMIHISRKFAEGDFSRRIIQPSRDEIGELAVTLNKMSQDIEDKIKEIKTQNQKLAAIFNSMIEGVIVTDRTGHIVSINSTVEKIFAVKEEEVKGRLFLEAVRNNDIAEVLNNVLNAGKAVAVEISLVLPVRRTFEINAAPIFSNDNVSGCLAVIHDITGIRMLETMRKDFVANVSHELKTPLTSIKGFVETLLEGALDDKENNRNFLKIIQEHTERLNKLVDDLLSLSHLESKEIILEKENVLLRSLVEKVIQGFKVQLKNKGVEIKNELPHGLFLTADKDRLEQVFTNLIDNAIKFNKEKGLVWIYSECSGNIIRITVEDSGLGIPQKDIPRIFERFYRVDKARSRELGGTGLGLSIAKHVIELHNGSIAVESTEGFGSKFFFTLPK